MKKSKTVLSNRRVDSLIVNGEWAIDLDFASNQIQRYMMELDLIAAGASRDDIGIKERLAAEKSEIIEPSGNRERFYRVEKVASGSIARIFLNGTMRTDGGMSSQGIKSIVNEMRLLAAKPNIGGFLIDANTGGGESSSGYIFSSAVKDIIAQGKPVVTLAYSLGSAGVHATAFSTEIIAAYNEARIGSIGSFLSINNKFAKWYNKNYTDIYSKNSPDKNFEFREFLKGNLTPFQELVDKSDSNFMSIMKQARNLKGSEAVIKKTLSGGMFEAKEAKRRGLIDSIGSEDYAIKRLRSYMNFNNNK